MDLSGVQCCASLYRGHASLRFGRESVGVCRFCRSHLGRLKNLFWNAALREERLPSCLLKTTLRVIMVRLVAPQVLSAEGRFKLGLKDRHTSLGVDYKIFRLMSL
jgi:hypothetical protein